MHTIICKGTVNSQRSFTKFNDNLLYIYHKIYNTSLNISKMQSGYLYHYAFVMLLGVIAFTLTLSLSSIVDPRLYTQFIATAFLYLYFAK